MNVLFLNAIIICAAYLLGSIPFGLVVTKCAGLGDIRKIGSGNIGATNVLRTGKKSLAVLTVVLDGGKGWLVVFLAQRFWANQFPDIVFDQRSMDFTYCAAFAVFIGHLFSVWLKFKGGKGVATTFGILLGLAWPIGLGAMLVWILVAAITRYSSLAAVISIGLAPIAGLVISDGFYTHGAAFGFLIFGFILYTHRANIQRLMAGTEAKIGKKK